MAYFECPTYDSTVLSLPTPSQVSGAVANFETDVVLPLIDVKAEIKAVETGTGAKSPSNPYVISGFNGANLYHNSGFADYFYGVTKGTYCAVALSDLTWTTTGTANVYLGSLDNQAQFDVQSKGNTITNLIASAYTVEKVYLASGLPNKQLSKVNASNHRIIIRDDNYNSLSAFEGSLGGKYIIFKLITPITPTISKAQFEALCTAFGIEGTVYTVSWQTEAGEVFGGYYDFTTGKLVATHQIGSLALSSVGWHEDANRAGVFYCGVPVAYGRKNASNVLACSCFNATNTSPNTTNDLYISGKASYSGTSVFFRNSEWTGKTSLEINTLLANETFVYELATPVEYDLTPQQISALLGVNNVWSDTNGNTTVKYFETVRFALH